MKKNERAELPVLEWDGDSWSTHLAFTEWPKNLNAWVQITPPSVGAKGEPEPPAAEQAAALAFLTARGNKVGAALLDAAKKHHAQCVKRGFENEDGSKLQPLRKPTDLNAMLELSSINVHQIVKAKHAYVGLSFSCSWDREHGFGVMLHKRRVVSAGGADHAILEWIATRDGGVALGEKQKPTAKKSASEKVAKPGPRKPAPKKSKPAAKKPAAKKPAAKKPAAKKPAAKKR